MNAYASKEAAADKIISLVSKMSKTVQKYWRALEKDNIEESASKTANFQKEQKVKEVKLLEQRAKEEATAVEQNTLNEASTMEDRIRDVENYLELKVAAAKSILVS